VHELRRLRVEPQALEDLVTHDGRGRSGARQHPRRRQLLQQCADPQILRPEVVAPLADAVRLVDRDEGTIEVAQQSAKPLEAETLGRRVRQRVLASGEGRHTAAQLVGLERRGEIGGADPALLERAHLVVHQCDEGGDDERGPAQQQRRQLVGQALATAGGCHEEQTPHPQQRLDRLALPRAKRRVSQATQPLLERGARDGRAGRVGRLVDVGHAVLPGTRGGGGDARLGARGSERQLC
jgi:hypothetical protein